MSRTSFPSSLSSAALLLPVLFLDGCAPSQQQPADAAPLSPTQLAIVEKHLGDKVPGEPVKCLSNYRTLETVRVSDNMLIYRSGGNLAYRNDLRGSCPGLARDSDIMVVRQFGSGICAGDFFHLVDRSSGIRGATCVFGEFIPYRKEKDAL